MTELEIEKIIKDFYQEELKTQPWEEVADGLDFWRDKDGFLLMEGRGMHPLEGVEWVAYVDNGIIWER